VIKIFQGSVVTQTVLGGLTIYYIIFQLLISYSVCKLLKVVGTRQSYCNNLQAYFLTNSVYNIHVSVTSAV